MVGRDQFSALRGSGIQNLAYPLAQETAIQAAESERIECAISTRKQPLRLLWQFGAHQACSLLIPREWQPLDGKQMPRQSLIANAGWKNDEVFRLLEPVHGSEQSRRRRDYFALVQIQPPTCTIYFGAEFAIGPIKLMTKEEPAAVLRMPRKQIGYVNLLLQPDFPEIVNFVSHHHGADSEPRELLDGKAVFHQEHLANVGSLVQVGRILHVRVEIHVGPTCIKCLRVNAIAPPTPLRG